MAAIMPDQWKSITGLAELEQPASTKSPESSTVEYASPVDSRAIFVRALFFGIAVALLLQPLYIALLCFVFRLYIGFVALPAGWLVGKAIKKGSRGAAGLRYRIAAVLLTYSAVCIASVPLLMATFVAERRDAAILAVQSGSADMLWGKVILWSTFAPFLEFQRGAAGFIGEIALFAGLYIAYRSTAATVVAPHSR